MLKLQYLNWHARHGLSAQWRASVMDQANAHRHLRHLNLPVMLLLKYSLKDVYLYPIPQLVYFFWCAFLKLYLLQNRVSMQIQV